MPLQNSTIIAIATPPGQGAIGLIRLSGPDAIGIIQKIFSKKNIANQASHTLHFGRIIAQKEGTSPAEMMPEIVDEVVLSLYKNPHSYTGEDVVELSCHGATYILQRIMELCVSLGAVPAKAGEFTQRAFLNGKLDLTQAEAVGDLIAAESKAAQQAAMNQLRGGFSKELKEMREELINFSALMELELDFSQEDVEFADRSQLNSLLDKIEGTTSRLIDSFRLGNAVKNGVSVAIIGAPNAGKSTLLNALLNEERAIVSEIAGTTRDTIEEVLNIGGILFRFIDTAGIREHTDDTIEQQGIARSRQKAAEADVVIQILDAGTLQESKYPDDADFAGKQILVINKADLLPNKVLFEKEYPEALFIVAKNKEGLDQLRERLLAIVMDAKVQPGDTIITNTRHLSALKSIALAIADIKTGLSEDIPGDLIALDIRQALHYIGELTGQVLHDRDILGAVFGSFCIGK